MCQSFSKKFCFNDKQLKSDIYNNENLSTSFANIIYALLNVKIFEPTLIVSRLRKSEVAASLT